MEYGNIKCCYKTCFYYGITCNLKKNAYLCHVFFIVLD